MKKILVICFLGLSVHVFSQYSISGNVKNEEEEALFGANVVISNTYRGTVTDKNGQFEFKNLKRGNYVLRVVYLGYEEVILNIDLTEDLELEFEMVVSDIISEEVVIHGIRASSETPTTFSMLQKEDIVQSNNGKDLPFLLSTQPSVVVTSDAGHGVGYTGIRIRGNDSKKINVTINGIPLNDAESHGVYWVDIPDIAGSTENIQIQRGVGSSTNGAAAFGASINIMTDNFSRDPFSQISASVGSFGTHKVSLDAGTGLMNDHWFLETKGSIIQSDGYIDRSRADLKSYFIQGGYYSEKTLIKAIAFGGWEETYQAWYGIDDYMAEDMGRTFNSAGAYYIDRNTGRTVGFWDGYYRENKDNLDLTIL